LFVITQLDPSDAFNGTATLSPRPKSRHSADFVPTATALIVTAKPDHSDEFRDTAQFAVSAVTQPSLPGELTLSIELSKMMDYSSKTWIVLPV
jgi:hypothetical protein